jgi:hypothetical protein
LQRIISAERAGDETKTVWLLSPSSLSTKSNLKLCRVAKSPKIPWQSQQAPRTCFEFSDHDKHQFKARILNSSKNRPMAEPLLVHETWNRTRWLPRMPAAGTCHSRLPQPSVWFLTCPKLLSADRGSQSSCACRRWLCLQTNLKDQRRFLQNHFCTRVTSDECTKLQRRRPANGTMNVRTSLPMMQRTVEPRRSCVCRCFHLLCFSGAPVGNEASGELTVFVLSMTS